MNSIRSVGVTLGIGISFFISASATPIQQARPVAAYPRPGAVKLLENDRVIAWNYSWIEGRPAPMHFHIHQQVVAVRYDGAI